MKPEPQIFDQVDENAEAVADARADRDVETGRTVSHDAMRRWLKSWGGAKPLPRPKCGE